MREILPILDFDDTVIMGSTPMYNYCYDKGLRKIGLELDERRLRNATDTRWGASHVHQFEHIVELYMEKLKYTTEEEANQLVEEASEEFMLHLDSTFVEAVGFLPGTVEALGKIAVKPALATGVHPAILPKILDKVGLTTESFDPIVTSYDIPLECTKPNPYMIYEVLQRRKASRNETFSPDEAVVIGDSINDMLMGNRAGTHTIAVLTGRMTEATALEFQKPNGETRIKIDHIAKTIIEVPELLEKMSSD